MPQIPSGPLPGTATKQLTVGRYVLTVGAPAGTLIVPTRRAERHGRNELARALTAAGAAGRIEEAVEEAGDVTGRVERALELTTALAEGRLDHQTVLREADALFGLLARLDREGRHGDALRLARALIALLALLGRWQALVQSLRLALRAARTIGDRASEAWAHHEIGTFSLAGGDKQGAASHLDAALRIRQDLGDETGAQVTASNLAVARMRPPLTRLSMLAVAGIVALLIAGTVAGILYARDGDDDSTTTTESTTTDNSPPPPTLPTAKIVEAPADPTNDTTAVFQFTADPDVGRFACRLDDGDLKPCSSGQLYPDLTEEPHFFLVVPKAPDGRSGQPDEYSWTVDTTPPTTTIESTEPSSNSITVIFSADDAQATYMCWLNGGEPRTCSSPHTFSGLTSGMGYVIEVQATDEAGNEGNKAKTKDTTVKGTTTGTTTVGPG